MKKSTCQVLLVAINIFFLTFNLSAQSPATSVKFRLVREFLIIVPVQINDSETLEFLLDTGTNTNVIVPEAAARLKLHAIDRIEMVTIAGSVTVPRSFPLRLTVGDASLEGAELLWSDLPELRRLDNRISGILGQNFLVQSNFTLNLRERRMTFGDPDETKASRAIRIPFEIVEERILVKIKLKDVDLKVVLDSGAPNLILFASGCRKLAKKITPDEQMTQVITNTGKRPTRTGLLDKLQFGGKSWPRLPVVLLSDVERAYDGLLPLHLFRSVHFNNRDKYLTLDPATR